jgi:hypothetical protein
MGSKQVSIVVDLRTGKNVIHVPDLIAILSAAGYKPEVALKAYRGETLKLTRKAAREGCGLVIGYGGDLFPRHSSVVIQGSHHFPQVYDSAAVAATIQSWWDKEIAL